MKPIQVATGALIFAAIVAALGHSLSPGHWLPYALTAKAKALPMKRAMVMVLVGAISHLISTVFLGVLFVFAGEKLSAGVSENLNKFISFVVLVIGLYFVWNSLRRQKQKEPCLSCGHTHEHKGSESDCILGALLGLRACPEAIPIFMAISTRGVFTSLTAIGAWVVASVIGLVGAVWLSLRGIEAFRWQWLERNGELLSGCVIVFVGILTFLMKEG